MTDHTRTGSPRPLIADTHWRIEHIQVINWGGFHQKVANFHFHPDATIVTGASGVGKSTVLDAYLALMMPSDVAFNGASNAASGGRARGSDQRSLRTYLTGKTDDTVEDGMTVDKSLRGHGKPTWGAVAATFIADTGTRFTAIRAYFVPAAATRDGDILKRMMTISGPFNISELYDFARVGSESYPAKAMKARWSGLRIYGSYEEFAQSLFSRLGIGHGGDGAKALGLLARIQAGTMSRTVDELYKKLVIDVPDTFNVADEAINAFDELDEMYRKMEVSQKQADLLEPIVALHEQMLAAQHDIAQTTALGSIDADDTPAGLWRLRTHAGILRDEDDALREQTITLDAQLRTSEAATRNAEQLLDSAKAEYEAGGGNQDKQLTHEITAHEQLAETRRGMRARLNENLATLDLTADSEEQLLAVHTRARAFADHTNTQRAELEARREQLIRAEHPLLQELDDIKAELRSLDGRAGRVDRSLDARRREAAAEAGMDAADLPFVAELIDVAEGEEKWRTAIETVLYASARTLLVPNEHLERFSRAIEPLKSSLRLTFEGVERTHSPSTVPLDPQRIAGKLDYKNSPYQAWVIEHLTNVSRNALCVPNTDGLSGGGLRVTPGGQTRRNRRGSHGGNTSRPIIGFDNAQLTHDLERQRDAVRAQLDASAKSRSRVAAELAVIDTRKAAFERTLDFEWSLVDVDTPLRQAAELRALQDKLLAGDGALAALKKQVERHSRETKAAQHKEAGLRVQLDTLTITRGELATIIDHVNDVLWPVEDDETVALDDTLAARLEHAWDRILGGEPATRSQWNRLLIALRGALDDLAAHAREAERSAITQIERAFHAFQGQWNDPTRGETIASYPEYVAILDEITRVGIHEQRQQWRRSALQWSGKSLRLLGSAMSSAVDDIGTRLDSVNAILERLPFGPTDGRLKIEMKKNTPQKVATFRGELDSFRKLATKSTSDDDLVTRFAQMREFIARIRRRDDPALTPPQREIVAREDILDVRRHVDITARELTPDARPAAEYSSLAGKSGGEMQELVAFIVGAALRFQLGDELGQLPRFAPVFLDEGFIKADSEYAGRAVEAWKGLGFQLVVGAPLDKYTGLEPHVAETIVISKNRDTGHSFVDHVHHRSVA